jgi:hypothetical protein
MAVHERRSAHGPDQGVEVLDLALGRIRWGVAAVAAAPAVVGEDREAWGQGGRQRRARVSVIQCTQDEDQCRPLARALVGEARAID